MRNSFSNFENQKYIIEKSLLRLPFKMWFPDNAIYQILREMKNQNHLNLSWFSIISGNRRKLGNQQSYDHKYFS